jgi:hypothetical protein
MEAHTNLMVYAAVAEILEGGLLTGNVGGTAQRIIAMCKKEQHRQLKLMDAAVAAAEKGSK